MDKKIFVATLVVLAIMVGFYGYLFFSFKPTIDKYSEIANKFSGLIKTDKANNEK